MSDFKWDEKLRLGVDPMDKDHQKIIALMNDLEKAREQQASFTELERAFRNLAEFTAQHFREEEVYMESIAFPQLNSHKLIHKRLLDTLQEHYENFQQSKQLNEQVFTFLSFWLKSHICGIDKQYAEMAVAV